MKYTAAQLRDEIKLAMSEGRAIVFKKFFDDNPSWEELLDVMSEGFHDQVWGQRPSGYPALEPAIGRLMVRGRFYVTIRLDSDASPLEGVKSGFNFLQEAVTPSKLEASHAVISFVRDEKGTETEVHSDPVHTFYWQTKGKSNWRFFKERCCVHCVGRQYFDAQVEVEPGDLLFMPREMFHTVHVTGPRSAVIFRFEHDDELYTLGALKPEDPKIL